MTLLHSPAEVLTAVLIGKDVAADPLVQPIADYAAYISHLPPDKARAISVYDTEPLLEARILSTGLGVRRHGCQIVVRCGEDEYADGWGRVQVILETLEEVSSKSAVFDDGTYRIRDVEIESGPMYFGREPQLNWVKFSLNVLILYGKV